MIGPYGTTGINQWIPGGTNYRRSLQGNLNSVCKNQFFSVLSNAAVQFVRAKVKAICGTRFIFYEADV